MSLKCYWKLPVTQVQARDVRALEEVASLTAEQRKSSDWITHVRTVEGNLLQAFGQLALLTKYATGMGWMVIGPEGITTTLADTDFAGENAGLDVAGFVATFAGLMNNIIAPVDDDLAAKLIRYSNGGMR